MNPKEEQKTINKLSASIMEVIFIISLEGAGTTEDPIRHVDYYYTKSGQLIARIDPLEVTENILI